MLWFATICNFRADHYNPRIPCKTGHSGANQGETKQWLKYYSSATAIDKNYSMSIENNYISKNIKFDCEYPLIMLKYKY